MNARPRSDKRPEDARRRSLELARADVLKRLETATSGPHREMLTSIEAFLAENLETSDKRILMQLADVRVAIRQVLDQLSGEE